MTKSIKTAYILWVFGGLFGLHHFYLKRDKQGFIWLTTIGGFLIGFLHDIYKIPDYVKEANEDIELVQKLKNKQSKLKSPIFINTRFVSCILVSAFFGYVTKYCLHSNESEINILYTSITKFITPFVVGFIVYLIGTEGPMKCNVKWPILGSYIAFFVDMLRNSSSNFNSPFLSTLFLNWAIEWDKEYFEKRKKKKLSKRIFYISLGIILTASVFSIFVWNNARFNIDGQEITFKQYVFNFLEKDEVKQLTEIIRMIWNFYRAHGLKRLINNFIYGYDPEAISHANEILGLNDRSTQEDIDQKCRALSRKWHPDKYKDPVKKLEAEKMFMDVQESCNILSEHRKSKINQNKKSEDSL